MRTAAEWDDLLAAFGPGAYCEARYWGPARERSMMTNEHEQTAAKARRDSFEAKLADLRKLEDLNSLVPAVWTGNTLHPWLHVHIDDYLSVVKALTTAIHLLVEKEGATDEEVETAQRAVRAFLRG
jgi:hemoglobin-like flavoprotein